MTIKEALEFAGTYLAERDLRLPQQDAEALITMLLQKSRAFLYAHPEFELSRTNESIFHQWLNKRGEHYPIQYLRGKQEFYGLDFLVHPGVFIPRPETELLVDVSMTLLRQHPDINSCVADVGTGSGCIAITLAHHNPNLTITAIDISPTALETAKQNAETHSCLGRIEFHESSMLTAVKERAGGYRLIVSNPPYVGFQDKAEVEPSVRKYEPREAVFSGQSGMEAYLQLFAQSEQLLKPGGWLVLELGANSLQPVISLGKQKNWRLNQAHSDLAGIERCAVFQRYSSDNTF